jgi:hypothetical protein
VFFGELNLLHLLSTAQTGMKQSERQNRQGQCGQKSRTGGHGVSFRLGGMAVSLSPSLGAHNLGLDMMIQCYPRSGAQLAQIGGSSTFQYVFN